MRVSFAILVFTTALFAATLVDAQDQGRRRRGGDYGDSPQFGGGGFRGDNGGGPWGGGGGMPGGGGPWGGGGGMPGGGGPWGGGGPGGGFGGSRGGGPGGGQSREERMAGFLQQFDANRDGQIDASEVQAAGPRAGFLDMMIRRAGIEPKYPIKVSTIQEGMQNARNNGNRGGGPWGPPQDNAAPPAGPGGTPANGETKAASAAPLVPGFGVEQKKGTVPGFDAVPTQAGTVAATSSPGSAESGSADAPAKTPDHLTEAVRRNAELVFKQNDKDHSNSLENDRGEWAELRGDPKAMDRDRNGAISLEEFTAFKLAENGVRVAKRADSGKKAAAAATPAADSLPKTGKTYRILSPLERLPEGLPDWFARNDANGDGQVSMPEYAREWTSSKAGEFAHYDLNGDGVITSQECLQVEKGLQTDKDLQADRKK